MEQKNELDSLIKKIGKLHKMIRFVAIINKNGKIIKSRPWKRIYISENNS